MEIRIYSLAHTLQELEGTKCNYKALSPNKPREAVLHGNPNLTAEPRGGIVVVRLSHESQKQFHKSMEGKSL